MKVAHVISNPRGFGGAEKILQALAEGTVRNGGTATIMNPFADADDLPLKTAARAGGITYREVKTKRPWGILRARRWLRREIAAGDFDLVHVHLFHAALLLATLRKLSTPIVATHHHGGIYGGGLRSRLDRWAFRRMDRVVAVSEDVLSLLRDRYGIPSSKLHLIRNGWSGAPILTGGTASEPIVLTVGNLRPEKDHDLLLQAFVLVLESVPDARLRIVGSGPLLTELQRWVIDAGLTESVTLLGYQDDIWPEMQNARVFALPSRYETSGLVLLEAMAAGLPVVSTGVGGTVEILKDEQNALVVRPGHVEGMASAIVRALTEEDLRVRLIEQGRETATLRSIDKTVEDYLALYAQAIAVRGGAA